MDFNSLIDKNVDKAFKILVSLTKDIILTKKAFNDFNFGTGQSSYTSSVLNVRGFVLDAKKITNEHVTVVKSLLIKTKDVGDISSFDLASIDGVNWSFGEFIRNDNYVIQVELVKEA